MKVQDVIEIVRQLAQTIDGDVVVEFDSSRWFARDVVVARLMKGPSVQTVEVSMEEAANAMTGSSELRSRLEGVIAQLS